MKACLPSLLILMRATRSRFPKIKRRFTCRASFFAFASLFLGKLSPSTIFSVFIFFFFPVFLVQTNRRRLGKSTHLYADYVLLGGKQRETEVLPKDRGVVVEG